MSKLSRGDKGELEVIKVLSSLKVHHQLINNFTYVNPKSKLSHQIDHILIHPYGVFVIETKNYFGHIISEADDVFWLKIVGNKTERIANPIKQNKSHSIIINKLLNRKYDIISVIVFAKDNCPYTGDDNVINLNDLLLMIDSYPYKRILDNKEIDEIYSLLLAKHQDIELSTHLDNIKKIKRRKADDRENMTYAIERGLCPMCNSKLKIVGDKYRCLKCGYNFDLSK